MTRRLRFRARAEAELLEARIWYDDQEPGLGERFVLAVDATLDRITETPFSYPLADNNIRCAVVSGYSYNGFFRVLPDEVIVVAVVHTSRHPDRWRGRT